MRRTQLRALRRDCSQSNVHECETPVRRSAKIRKDPNVSPRESQTPSAKTRLAMSSQERQPTKRCQKCLKHERESKKAPPDVQTGRSVHTYLSRGVPADHEARSQVKKKDSCKRESTRRRPHPRERLCTTKFKSVGTVARVHARERERESSEHVKGSSVRQ